MTLLRTTPADHIPPWGERVLVEDKFDLGDRGVILQVGVSAPSISCRVRLHMPGKPVLEVVAAVDRPIGDHKQSALLIRGIAASDIPRGAMIEFVDPKGC